MLHAFDDMESGIDNVTFSDGGIGDIFLVASIIDSFEDNLNGFTYLDIRFHVHLVSVLLGLIKSNFAIQ